VYFQKILFFAESNRIIQFDDIINIYILFKMNSQITAPVLLIAFNRPDTTRIVFNRIREVKPLKFYIAVDGPRNNKPGEESQCKEVVEITKNIDWICDAKYLIRNANLGCKAGVSGAISWVLDNEDRVIIVEDDVLPVVDFFYFAEELLEKYKNEEKVSMISANNYTPLNTVESDYLFSKYGHIWGWATWKRTWEKFDVNAREIEDCIKDDLKNVKFLQKREKKYFLKYFFNIMVKEKKKISNAWGPQFVFYRFNNNLLSVVPRINLASNIGVLSSRNNKVDSSNNNFYPTETGFKLSRHPDNIELDVDYDIIHFNKHISPKITWLRKAIQKLSKIMNQYFLAILL
jgi:hypothetical protein